MLRPNSVTHRAQIGLPLCEGGFASSTVRSHNLVAMVAEGLRRSPPSLDYPLLYDCEGSRLFDQITQLPEYYVTRSEASILRRHAGEIAAIAGPVPLIEFGAGSGTKTSLLIDAFEARYGSARYIPVDVSETALEMAFRMLSVRHPCTQILPVCGVHETSLSILESCSPALGIFLGSSIGNFTQQEEERFYTELSRRLRSGGAFLLGVDLVKDPDILERAYNDSEGVTASFIANLFRRIERELDVELDMNGFNFEAKYDESRDLVEIRASFDDGIRFSPYGLERTVEVAPGEPILVEICRKYRLDTLVARLQTHALKPLNVFVDEDEYFADLIVTHRDND